MKASDEDLKVVTACLAAFVTRDGSALLGDAIVTELRALRKIADAARSVVLDALAGDGDAYQRRMPIYDALYEALKEAGR